jgi:tryptophanyl-tRNA synthetase
MACSGFSLVCDSEGEKMERKRILSGMRPTGKLHLGNYAGVLVNWVRLQDEYRCFFEVADWHALTTAYDKTADLTEDTVEVVIDWLSAGIDIEKSVVFLQSDVKEHAELHLLLSMLVSVPRLQRNPTLKEQVRDLDLGENISYGHLGYPVLQAADILLYKGDAVPVGEDQLPHLEITRELARKFNTVYGVDVFPIPEPILTKFARLPGLDGKRMSKSLGNVILLADPPETILSKVMTAITDPEKIRMGDRGHPDICNIFAYHQTFSQENIAEIEATCKEGSRGCVACKKEAAEAISHFLAPIREKRAEYEKDRGRILKILQEGAVKARETAGSTMVEVRRAMNLELG